MIKLRRFIPEIIVLIYAILFFVTKNPNNQWDRVIVSDGKGYYAYLTALFIYDDTDFGFIDKYEAEYYPDSRLLYKDFRFDTGNGIVNKYFPGPAVLWLPFFAAGHAYAYLFDYQTDGYSLPYQMAIALAALFYFWLGLLILRRILRFYSEDENAIAWSLLAVGLATNLVYYTVNAGSQVHVFNFFLINGFIYSILEACKRGKPAWYAAAAFMLGMIIISRPQNGLIVFALPFICGSKESFLSFFRKVISEYRVLLSSAVAFAAPILIPLLYWYAKTGHFLVYSYGNESFDLSKPHLFSFLFSFEKGWLLYTPLAAFSLLGFVHLFRKSKWQFFSLSAFLFFVVYFLSSWWIWNYTSYVSQRVMIDFYPFMAILLLFIFSFLHTKKHRLLLTLVLSGFIILNIFQHFQQLYWVYPAGPVTAKSYFSNFFSLSKGTTFMIPENEVLDRQSYFNDFENPQQYYDTPGFMFSSRAYAGNRALICSSDSTDKPLFVKGMAEYKESKPVLLKIGGFFNPATTDSTLAIEVCLGSVKKKYSVTPHNLITLLEKGKWKYAEMVVYLPYIHSVSDSLFISVKNLCSGDVLLDDMTVELLKMKPLETHDWLLSAYDPVDSAIVYHTNLETNPEVPWGNTGTIAVQQSFSGDKSSAISLNSPYSVGFEKEVNMSSLADGYFRVSAQISGDSTSEVNLVFDFQSEGKTVLYKNYPVLLNDNNSKWKQIEIFREFPVSRLKAQKVKIYFWYIKGKNPVYIDDIQVDVVKYEPAVKLFWPTSAANKNASTLYTSCCDFEQSCLPESGTALDVDFAFSGKKVGAVSEKTPFSFAQVVPLGSVKNITDAFVFISAEVNTDAYLSGATLVTDFKQKGKSVYYHPIYLHRQTIKGSWQTIEAGVKMPREITENDTVIVYFYLPDTDEMLLIDDFCVRIKKPNPPVRNRKK